MTRTPPFSAPGVDAICFLDLDLAAYPAAIVLGQVVTASLAAYAFARLRFSGKDLLFVVLMSAMMGIKG